MAATRPSACGWRALEGGTGPADDLVGVVAQPCHRAHHPRAVARDAAAVHVAGQDGVAGRGPPPRLLVRVLVEAGATVDQQEAWSLPGHRVLFVDRSVEGRAVENVRDDAGSRVPSWELLNVGVEPKESTTTIREHITFSLISQGLSPRFPAIVGALFAAGSGACEGGWHDARPLRAPLDPADRRRTGTSATRRPSRSGAATRTARWWPRSRGWRRARRWTSAVGRAPTPSGWLATAGG